MMQYFATSAPVLLSAMPVWVTVTNFPSDIAQNWLVYGTKSDDVGGLPVGFVASVCGNIVCGNCVVGAAALVGDVGQLTGVAFGAMPR